MPETETGAEVGGAEVEATEIEGAIEYAAQETVGLEAEDEEEAAPPQTEAAPEWRPIVLKWRVPIAAATVALLAGIVVRLGVHWSALPLLAFASTAVALAVIDFAILRLPNALTGPTSLAVAGALVAQALAEHRTSLLVTAVEGAAAVAAFYLLLFVLSHGGLGLGDVKVGAVAGAVMAAQGWQYALNGTFLSYLITLVIAMTLLLRKRKKFPYGPGLLAGTIAVLLI